MFEKRFGNKCEYLYSIFRILVGLLFLQHGLQKVFGLIGGNVLPTFSFFWWSGFIELIVGILLVLGLFSRLAAFFGAVEMLVAYFKAHAFAAVMPINNGGELALLYFAAFLAIMANGAKNWSLEKLLFKKEIF